MTIKVTSTDEGLAAVDITRLSGDVRLRKTRFRARLIRWGNKHFRGFPWRIERTPYSILISEILLRRTTATAVKRVYEEFLSRYPNLSELAKADSEVLEEILARIGFHRKRTKILIEVADFVLRTYDGKIPNSREQLLCIPHVGNYTANSVLAFAYAVPTAIVDSNVERIIRRVFLGNVQKKMPLKAIQNIADMLAPETSNQEYNYALLDLGAMICLYNIPNCKLCPVNSLCDYYILGSPHK